MRRRWLKACAGSAASQRKERARRRSSCIGVAPFAKAQPGTDVLSGRYVDGDGRGEPKWPPRAARVGADLAASVSAAVASWRSPDRSGVRSPEHEPTYPYTQDPRASQQLSEVPSATLPPRFVDSSNASRDGSGTHGARSSDGEVGMSAAALSAAAAAVMANAISSARSGGTSIPTALSSSGASGSQPEARGGGAGT